MTPRQRALDAPRRGSHGPVPKGLTCLPGALRGLWQRCDASRPSEPVPFANSPDVSPRGSGIRSENQTSDPLVVACYPAGVNDTSIEAARIQALVHRRMGGPRKLLIACQMSDAVRAMACARIRSRHPELNERGIRDELIWELYGVRRRH
jgi:hypothetical protein